MSSHDHIKYIAHDGGNSASHAHASHHPSIKDEYDSAAAGGGIETDSSTSNSTSSASPADGGDGGGGSGINEPVGGSMKLQRLQQRKENMFRLPRELKLPKLAAYSACQADECNCLNWKSPTTDENRIKDVDVSPSPPSNTECRTCKHSLRKLRQKHILFKTTSNI